MRRAVFNMRDDRPIWAPPAWVTQRLRAALPADWELAEVSDPVRGRGDGGGVSAQALAAARGAEVYFGLGLPRDLLEAALEPPARLRWVHTGAAGVASLLHPEVATHEIMLTNSAGIHGPPIAETVIAEGSIRIEDLTERFGISLMTAHRDVDELVSRGLFRKTRGIVSAAPTSLIESSDVYRATRQAKEKKAIARAAMHFVEPGHAIFLDDATTVHEMTAFLPAKVPLTVITNGVALLNERVGANYQLAPSTNGVIDQWRFYIFTNFFFTNQNVSGLTNGSNVAFVTFLPPNLSRSRVLEADIDLLGLTFDTALAGFLIDPAGGMPDLSDLAGRVLGVEIAPAPEGQAEGQATLDFTGPETALESAARRAVAIAGLVDPLRRELEGRGGLALFAEVELPLARVLARMEAAGIGVDRHYLEELGESLRDRLATLEGQVYQAAGEEFNLNSTLQLRAVLYDRLGLPVLKKTPKGQPSTDASVLQKLVDEHPLVEHLLHFRELEKLRSTYVDGLLPLIAHDGRIHCVFNQTGAATGRISSERPNMQNIPVRSEEGRTIRRAFVAASGHSFVVADYSQIELRILAHMSGEKALVEAFAAGNDVHTATAARVFGVDPADVDYEMRRRAKVINFGLLYGMEAYGLAQRLEIDTEEAKEHIEAYFAQFPGVKDFMTGIVSEARNTGYTETILGRRRYLPELTSDNFRERQAAERMALNAPIQGSAADIIKKAMVELDSELETAGGGAALLLQVHDELVLEAPDDEVNRVVDRVTSVMEGIATLRVPLVVEVGIGRSLADVKK